MYYHQYMYAIYNVCMHMRIDSLHLSPSKVGCKIGCHGRTSNHIYTITKGRGVDIPPVYLYHPLPNSYLQTPAPFPALLETFVLEKGQYIACTLQTASLRATELVRGRLHTPGRRMPHPGENYAPKIALLNSPVFPSKCLTSPGRPSRTRAPCLPAVTGKQKLVHPPLVWATP